MAEQHAGGPGEEPWSSDEVQRLRAHLGVTQAELAARIGTRQQTISEWETGTRAPRRMARRLLRMVAEESGLYETGATGARIDRPADPPDNAR